MIVVYRLKEDQRFIEGVQRATRTTKNFGIEPTHGIFGSDEWWKKIDTGELQVHRLKGRITGLYMESMNDWPVFEMTSDAGEVSRWTRNENGAALKLYRALNPYRARDPYRVGTLVEVDYVLQRHRPESSDKGAEVKQVLEIRVAWPENEEESK